MSRITVIIALPFLLFLGLSLANAAIERPDFKIYQSRTKEHRQRGSGILIEEEKHLRKIILGWYSIPNAEAYEICHQCVQDINDMGEYVSNDDADAKVGTVIPADAMCGGEPCLILPAAPMGWNHFHLRYKVGGEWSPWSIAKKFNVGEKVGQMDHEEL